MNKLWVALLSMFSLGAACTPKAHPILSMSPQEAQGELNNDFAILVDVREQDEIKAGMAAPARWEALSKIQGSDAAWKTFTQSLPKDKRIILYCRSGNRSGRVADKLAAEGFKTANMGGFGAWASAGLPTRKP